MESITGGSSDVDEIVFALVGNKAVEKKSSLTVKKGCDMACQQSYDIENNLLSTL